MSDNNLTQENAEQGLESFAADFLSGSVDNSDSNTGTPAELVTLAEEMLDVDSSSDQVPEADESKQESDEAETAEESDGDTPPKSKTTWKQMKNQRTMKSPITSKLIITMQRMVSILSRSMAKLR